MSVEERLKEVQALYEELLNSSNLDKIDHDDVPKTPGTNKMSTRELENSSGKIIPITERKEEYDEDDEKEPSTSENNEENLMDWKDFSGLDHNMKNNLIKKLILTVYFYHSKYKGLMRKFKALETISRSPAYSKSQLTPQSYQKTTSAEVQSNF